MKAEYRVKDAQGLTRGFVIDGIYRPYFQVKKVMNRIDNLILKGNKIVSKKNKLPIISIKEANAKYNIEIQHYVERGFIQRDVNKELEQWYNKFSDYILEVQGARQIGKTTEILKFAVKHYEQILYVNLVNDNSRVQFEKIVNDLNIYDGMQEYCNNIGEISFFNNQNTVLIIDEIQKSVVIYNNLRRLKALKCHIIIMGSYLGRLLNKDAFIPMGDLKRVTMTVLSFKEFCGVMKAGNLYEKVSIESKSNMQDYDKLEELYTIYKQIGGYPAVVVDYQKNRDVTQCEILQKELLDIFIRESLQYYGGDEIYVKASLETALSSIVQFMLQEKKGSGKEIITQLTKLTAGNRKDVIDVKEMNKAVTWLLNSDIIGLCDLEVIGGNVPRLRNRRIYFKDLGILNIILKEVINAESAKKGIVAENFAYTELNRLYSKGMFGITTPCCAIFNDYELDFYIEYKGSKIGLEVKSKKGKEPKSLGILLAKNKIDKGVIAEVTTGGIGEKWRRIPIYTIGRADIFLEML